MESTTKKPHQLKNGHAVVCYTPQDRVELIKAADVAGIAVYSATRHSASEYPDLCWSNNTLQGLSILPGVYYNWLPFDEFLLRIYGNFEKSNSVEVPAIPDGKTLEYAIPFDFKRWKSGNFVRIETLAGDKVEELHEFEFGKDPVGSRLTYPLVGYIGASLSLNSFTLDGKFWSDRADEYSRDLRLIVIP
jgi:hypothetical protein